MERKEEKRLQLLKYLANPENEFLSRTDLALTVLGYKNRESIYRLFPAEELAAIENEALEERKRHSGYTRAVVYNALYEQAKSGNVAAIKEYLDRFEGKIADKLESKNVTEHKIKELSPELMEMINYGKN